MAKLNRVVSVYAKSFYEGLPANSLDVVIEELKQFGTWLNESPELKRTLVSPMLSREQKTQILKDLLSKAKADPATVKVLTILAEKRRLDAADSIADQIEALKLATEGIVPIYVTSGLVLDSSRQKQVEARFEKLLNKKVKANYVVEPALIAGVSVTAAGKTYEGTMAGWLSRLNEEFSGGVHS